MARTTPKIMHTAIRRVVWERVRDEAMRRAAYYPDSLLVKAELIDLAAWCNVQKDADAQIEGEV